MKGRRCPTSKSLVPKLDFRYEWREDSLEALGEKAFYVDSIVFRCLMANSAACVEFRNDVVAVVGDYEFGRSKLGV